MLPAERGHMSKKLVGDGFGFGAQAQFVDGAAEIDSVPENDGGDGEIEAGGAVTLVLESPVTDFAEAMKEHGTLEGVVRLALVEPGIGSSTQSRVADPVEREQRALQTADFTKRLGKRVLSGVGGEATQDRRRRDSSGLDRSRQA